MNIIWIAIPLIAFGALSVLAFLEGTMTEPVWWSIVLPTLAALVLWKYRVSIWIDRHWNPKISQEEFLGAKSLAYGWLGMYFILVCGFLVALIASQYYDLKIPSAAIVCFFSLWWIKYELWGLVVCRKDESSGVRLEK